MCNKRHIYKIFIYRYKYGKYTVLSIYAVVGVKLYSINSVAKALPRPYTGTISHNISVQFIVPCLYFFEYNGNVHAYNWVIMV